MCMDVDAVTVISGFNSRDFVCLGLKRVKIRMEERKLCFELLLSVGEVKSKILIYSMNEHT